MISGFSSALCVRPIVSFSNTIRGVHNHGRITCLDTSMSSTPMTVTRDAENDLENRKYELLKIIQDTQRGLVTTADQRSTIEEAMVVVEGFDAGKEIDLSKLDGTWRLQYTSAPDVLVLFESAARLQFFKVGQIFQKFECQNESGGGFVRNVIKWSVPRLLEENEGATLIVSARFSRVSARNIYLKFDELGLQNINISDDLQAVIAPAILPRSFLSLQDFESSAITPRGLVRPSLFPNGNYKRQKVAPSAGPRKNLQLAVMEPSLRNDGPSLDTILVNYLDTLTQRVNFHLGYPVNICYDHYATLAPLLQFHLNNCGDPFIQSTVDFHSKDFEMAVLDWFAQLWEIEKDQYWGYVTNGGTEGNLHGILIGRELLPDGILYASKDSHYSVFKAARMYRMDSETINTSVNGEMDYSDLRVKLLQNKDKPAIINVTIGTTFKGAIDDLDIILQTLKNCGYSQDMFYIHCDAALYGLMVPFINNMISFKKPIGSVTISGHKFLGCPMPCGVQITRKSYVNNLSRKVECIASVDATISGSRNGLTPIFLWYSLSTKGQIGLQKDVKRCIDNAKYLKDRLQQVGISAMLNELSIIVVLERPRDHEFVRRWQLSCVKDMSHVIVMPGITREMLDNFINELVQQRKLWYQDGKAEPTCVADDIGAQNCACSYHKIGYISP